MEPANYCTHAIEYLRDLDARIARGAPEYRDGLELLIADLLTDAVKFILPDNGCLFDPDKFDYKPEWFNLQRLPYPVLALEYHANDFLYDANSGLTRSDRRIALVFDPHRLSASQQHAFAEHVKRPGAPPAYERLPARCYAVLAIYFSKATPQMQVDAWGFSCGVFIVDLDRDAPRPSAEFAPDVYDAINQRLRPGHPGTEHSLTVTSLLFAGRCMRAGLQPDEAHQSMYVDLIDEARATYEFLAALNCKNVGTQTIAAPAKLNKKRYEKGRVPFFDYHILDILVPGETSARKAGQGGSHASPRMHLRRGHIRQLSEYHGGGSTWVNETVVQRGAGQIDKTYRVRTK